MTTTQKSEKRPKLTRVEIAGIQWDKRRKSKERRKLKKQEIIKNAQDGLLPILQSLQEKTVLEVRTDATPKNVAEERHKVAQERLLLISHKLEKSGCLISVLAFTFSLVTFLVVWFK